MKTTGAVPRHNHDEDETTFDKALYGVTTTAKKCALIYVAGHHADQTLQTIMYHILCCRLLVRLACKNLTAWLPDERVTNYTAVRWSGLVRPPQYPRWCAGLQP